MKLGFSRFAAGMLFFSSAGSALCAPVLAADGLEFFEKQVRPILVERCYECHSTASKTKGGLALDSREATLKGGDSGAALQAGDPERSRLLEAVRYGNRDFQMPPKKRLSDPEIKALETWIRMGAPDPRTETAASKAGRIIDVKEGRKFWSFSPLAHVQPPKGSGTESPIDAFVQAKLQEHHLPSSPPADKRTLLRRAAYDLTGLPPTPQEMEVFLADSSPEAFERVIESLLASPHYGERWGRHWLDVVRYADSNGMDENVAFGHAWRYRDYVVRAFNQDKPFDSFLIEQIAGDLLPRSEESLVATGFLALGARVLAEPDVQKLEMDIIDEQIDTIGKTFLGMTLGCVRCHDHKFDPISQEDYYGLAAIFRSTRSLSYEKTGAIKYWYEHSLASAAETARKKETDDLLKQKQSQLNAFLSKARSEVKRQTESRAADYLAAAVLLAPDAQLKDAQVAAKPSGLRPEILLACRKQIEQHRDLPLLAEWWTLFPTRDPEGVRAHYAAVVTEALKAKAGPAYAALVDPKGFLSLPAKETEVLDAAALAFLATLRKEVAQIEATRPELPAAMGVGESKILHTIPIHIRGNHLTLGNPVERGFPEVMQPGPGRPILSHKQSGRLELARWLASSENPLTARVLVNRVWRWHFGRGIVSSTDNFGTTGGKPSHPELLDWLARRLIEGGWSIKDLHRQIMLSAVYQQSSDLPPLSADGQDPRLVDPENKLLWRANIQRLEAEQLRDALLATCGWLSAEMGGKTVPLRNREFVFNHTSKDATTYESARRTLYVPIIRNHLYDMLEQFDYPDPTMPTGSRDSTVIAPQALLMMNAPIVQEASKRLTVRLAKLASAEERIEEAYALLYSRPPLPEEMREALRVVGEFAKTETPERVWALFCHALYASNEFAYLR
jgi:hypothetical protein